MSNSEAEARAAVVTLIRRVVPAKLAAMALGTRALTPLGGFPVQLTCHVATWCWAAIESASLGITSPKSMLKRAGNIASMPNGPQRAMLAMPRAAAVDLTQGLPAAGTVLVWDALPTHSAVVTAQGITGYNQGCVATAGIGPGHISLGVNELAPAFRTCSSISETDIVRAAGGVFHL
ncbi:MAG: hypothetical protein KUG77_08800 [Nannocystaceae bacterium]|nr:hypothetical protein [Nannocystaceae bacterium]